MNNKRGLVLVLFVFFIVALAIIFSLIYFKIRFFGGVEFRTGNIVFNIDYEKFVVEEPIYERTVNLTNASNSDTTANISIKDHNITTD